MIYFFHHYELPAVILQIRIMAEVPANIHGNLALLDRLGALNVINNAQNPSDGSTAVRGSTNEQR